MPSAWEIAIVATMALFASVQGGLVIGFLSALRRGARPSDSGAAVERKEPLEPTDSRRTSPRVQVVLCVRGADPSLARCIRSLASLDYPNYRVSVVADHAGDAGLIAIRRSLDERQRERIDELVLDDQDRLESCSMKCSALIRACRELTDEVEFVATVDADTRPPADWLDRLIAPMLADPSIGATTGVRWYSPVDRRWGSWTRAVWNGAAIVQMWAYAIPWGGSMAVRRSLLERAGLLERWRTTFCEDTPTTSQLSRHGFRVRTVVDLILDNDESCRLRDVAGWIRRQLLTARLHHPAWTLVLGHAVATTVIPVAALVGAAIAVVQGDPARAGLLAGAWVIYQAAMIALVVAIDGGVRRAIRTGGHAPVARNGQASVGRGSIASLAAAVFASQWVHPWGAFGAAVIRAVTWRQIRYAVLTRGRVRRLDYAPYRSDAETATESL